MPISIELPEVGETSGVDAADMINTALTTIVDGVNTHSHVTVGLPITPNGMNINTDLDMQSNAVVLQKYSGFINNLTASAPSVGYSIYVKEISPGSGTGDLWFNNGAVDLPLTTGGGALPNADGFTDGYNNVNGGGGDEGKAGFIVGSNKYMFTNGDSTVALTSTLSTVEASDVVTSSVSSSSGNLELTGYEDVVISAINAPALGSADINMTASAGSISGTAKGPIKLEATGLGGLYFLEFKKGASFLKIERDVWIESARNIETSTSARHVFDSGGDFIVDAGSSGAGAEITLSASVINLDTPMVSQDVILDSIGSRDFYLYNKNAPPGGGIFIESEQDAFEVRAFKSMHFELTDTTATVGDMTFKVTPKVGVSPKIIFDFDYYGGDVLPDRNNNVDLGYYSPTNPLDHIGWSDVVAARFVPTVPNTSPLHTPTELNGISSTTAWVQVTNGGTGATSWPHPNNNWNINRSSSPAWQSTGVIKLYILDDLIFPAAIFVTVNGATGGYGHAEWTVDGEEFVVTTRDTSGAVADLDFSVMVVGR